LETPEPASDDSKWYEYHPSGPLVRAIIVSGSKTIKASLTHTEQQLIILSLRRRFLCFEAAFLERRSLLSLIKLVEKELNDVINEKLMQVGIVQRISDCGGDIQDMYSYTRREKVAEQHLEDKKKGRREDIKTIACTG
jgi:hypothetical protein